MLEKTKWRTTSFNSHHHFEKSLALKKSLCAVDLIPCMDQHQHQQLLVLWGSEDN